MSTSQQLREQKFTMPADLASPQTKLVYLSLRVTDEATVTELQQSLSLSKLTLLTVLESLLEMNLIRRTEGGYACQ